MVRSCARRSFAAETIFMALVICCVFLTERMRRRISIKLGMCLGQPLPDPAKPELNRNAYSPQRRRAQCHGRARGGMGWAIRECDFDAETRRRRDRRIEATRKRERARRQRRNVAFGSARLGYRRGNREQARRKGRTQRVRRQRAGLRSRSLY